MTGLHASDRPKCQWQRGQPVGPTCQWQTYTPVSGLHARDRAICQWQRIPPLGPTCQWQAYMPVTALYASDGGSHSRAYMPVTGLHASDWPTCQWQRVPTAGLHASDTPTCQWQVSTPMTGLHANGRPTCQWLRVPPVGPTCQWQGYPTPDSDRIRRRLWLQKKRFRSTTSCPTPSSSWIVLKCLPPPPPPPPSPPSSPFRQPQSQLDQFARLKPTFFSKPLPLHATITFKIGVAFSNAAWKRNSVEKKAPQLLAYSSSLSTTPVLGGIVEGLLSVCRCSLSDLPCLFSLAAGLPAPGLTWGSANWDWKRKRVD